MRTIIHIPDEQNEILNRMCKEKKVSRAQLIRDAIALLIEKQSKKGEKNQAFGLLRNRKGDGLTYEKKLRSEWDE